METNIRALQLPHSLLSQKTVLEVCEAFVNGSCFRGETCDRSHTICRAVTSDRVNSPTTSQKAQRPRVPASVNYLSLVPRSRDDSSFDTDGPGQLSVAGARHDNDYLHIRDIQILPTTDEILSRRSPYIPTKTPTSLHVLDAGPPRLLDTLFRQLRHDNVESIKDACYSASQKLATNNGGVSRDYEIRQETRNGTRYYLFWGVQFEELRGDERKGKGLVVRVSYNCPTYLCGRKMHSSGHLMDGMLAALVGLDDDGVSLSTTFFEVF